MTGREGGPEGTIADEPEGWQGRVCNPRLVGAGEPLQTLEPGTDRTILARDLRGLSWIFWGDI